MPRTIKTKLLGYAPDHRDTERAPELVYVTDAPVRSTFWQRLKDLSWPKKRELFAFVCLVFLMVGSNVWAALDGLDWWLPPLTAFALWASLWNARAQHRR